MKPSPELDKVLTHAETSFDSNVEKLKALTRIPSISAAGFPPEEVRRSAQAVAALLKEEGFENVSLLEVEGAHPYVYGDWLKAPGKPTLLLYAHHDVQPPGQDKKWKTPPFEPVQKGDRLFGRGSADDKAGIIVHTSALASYLKTIGKLPLNVKILIEGEEETGSAHLETFLKTYEKKMSADVIVLTDTENYDVGIPAITTSLRGLVSLDVEVTTMDSSVHSGMKGGPLPDPVLALAQMLAPLMDKDGKIAVPGIYDDVVDLSEVEKESFASLGLTEELFRERAHLYKDVALLQKGQSIPKQLWRLPSLAINAIQASSRERVSNIICDSAWCRVGVRTVPKMSAEKTFKQISDFLKKNAPWGVEVKITSESSAPWWLTNPDNAVFNTAREALTRAFGKNCVFIGQGGTIPFVDPFTQVLGGVPALMIGVEDPHTNAHSENESVHLGDLKKAIQGAIYLYDALAQSL